MHSYADQRTHDFFLNRDYPPIDHLAKLFKLLSDEPSQIDDLRDHAVARLGLSEEEFEKALEKLEIHLGARVDFGGAVTRGGTEWKKAYATQAQYRAEQFEKVLRFTSMSDCRMAALVRHFGDDEDAGQPCGHCDVCDPAGAVLRAFRHATQAERELVQRMIEELRPLDYLATGTLQRRIDPESRITRDQFESLLDAMTRAGLIDIEDAEFEKNGELIRFRKLRLTERGLDVRRATPLPLLISDGVVAEFAGKAPSRPTAKKTSKSDKKESLPPLTPAAEKLATQLKEWRAIESKRLGVPAYVVLHDRTMQAIAAARPTTPNELLALDGMGPAKLDKFGEAILTLCRAS